jgi:hypothetical protein
MTGTAAEWAAGTLTALPATGEYVIPQGMSVLRVDRPADTGVYAEPNIWVRHR